MLTSLSAIDAFCKVTPTLRLRMIGIGVVALTVFAVAMAIPASYLASFNTFVLLMLYFLVPWTAVNLMDFYVVRGGHYAIGEIFNPSGIYGRWGGSGLTAYAVGLLAMVPFMTLGFYTGPFAVLLGGADIAFLVGLLVAGSVYIVMCRKLDLEAERRVALRCEGLLEGERE
ncbi:cytosine permease [Serratia marcescens]|uniref:cytosine permease n=1 Tax=Serratia TaxID=613 RepID=UPI0039BF4C88